MQLPNNICNLPFAPFTRYNKIILKYIAVTAVISCFTCKRGEWVNSALC